ncbi:MAG: site-specific DNA-methyltransferase, partial [Chloroflexi bacterium]|nr:site-specific DNA-methyltransferase [Chloroflexota bacterium]
YRNELQSLFNPVDSLFAVDNKFMNQAGTKELKSLLDDEYFSNPKPIAYIKKLIKYSTQNDDIILDYFAGSGSSAHAVMELNVEDGGNRQSISVQFPELNFKIDKKGIEVVKEKAAGKAYKAGYRTIADITRARIEKVITKLKEEHSEKTEDLACAHFTLSPSNFKIWHNDVSTVDELRVQLELHQEAEKDLTKLQDSQKAMLTELLLKNGLGVMGVHAVSKAKVLDCGITIHRVFMEDDKHLWLCFETYQEQLKDEIVAARPAQVILLNSCFIGDKADEQLSNLRLELAGLEIGLLVI